MAKRVHSDMTSEEIHQIATDWARTRYHYEWTLTDEGKAHIETLAQFHEYMVNPNAEHNRENA